MARGYYDAVVAEYQADSNPGAYLENIALVAYTDLGHMAFLPVADQALSGETLSPDQVARLGDAIYDYGHAIELADTQEEIQHAISLMPYLLDAYCLNGQTEQARSVLDEFVTDLEDAEGVRDWIVEDLYTFGSCGERDDIR